MLTVHQLSTFLFNSDKHWYVYDVTKFESKLTSRSRDKSSMSRMQVGHFQNVPVSPLKILAWATELKMGL